VTIKGHTIAFLAFAAWSVAFLPAQTRSAQDVASYHAARDKLYQWGDWQFLLGTWEGSGKGFAGEGSGKFTFRSDLDGKVLVCTAEQHFSATESKPAFTYKSTIYVYLYGLKPRADLFDNEGHFLNFDANVTSSPHKVVLTSTETTAGFPRFRFSYTETTADQLAVNLEISPGSASTKYSSYIAGVVQRSRSSSN
jgi:hypothetical protein